MFELENLIYKYERQLKSVKEDFYPCTSCCDMSSMSTQEYEMERFIKDLKELRDDLIAHYKS